MGVLLFVSVILSLMGLFYQLYVQIIAVSSDGIFGAVTRTKSVNVLLKCIIRDTGILEKIN